MCLAAPLYADHVAHTDAFKNHLTEQVDVGGKATDVVAPDGVPIGPTWSGRFFLGADESGRDIAVRLLYGGRTSLMIGAGAALLTILLSVLVGHARGLFRRLGRHDHLALDGHHLVVSGAAARRRARHRAGARRPADRAADDRRRLADHPADDHRDRLCAVHGQTPARAGARAAREGVRRGGARAGPGPDPDHVLGDPAQPVLDDRRLLPADRRQRDPARGGAVVPRRRRAAADARRGAR